MSRILDFSDGFTSASEPLLGIVTASSLKVFATDADYISEKGAAAVSGDIYFNSTFHSVRFYDGTAWGNLVGNKFKCVYTFASPQAANTVMTLTNSNSYIVGSNTLWVSLNGQVFENGVDYNEIGTAGSSSTTIQMLWALEVGDRVLIRNS